MTPDRKTDFFQQLQNNGEEDRHQQDIASNNDKLFFGEKIKPVLDGMNSAFLQRDDVQNIIGLADEVQIQVEAKTGKPLTKKVEVSNRYSKEYSGLAATETLSNDFLKKVFEEQKLNKVPTKVEITYTDNERDASIQFSIIICKMNVKVDKDGNPDLSSGHYGAEFLFANMFRGTAVGYIENPKKIAKEIKSRGFVELGCYLVPPRDKDPNTDFGIS